MDDVWIKASIDLRLQQSWPEDAAAWNSGNVHQAGDFVRVIAWLLHAAPSHKHLALPYLSDQVIWDGLLLRATNKQDFNKVACLFKHADMPEATEVDDAGGVQGPANTFWQWQHPLTATVSQLSAGHTVIHMEAAAAVRVSFICSIMFTAAAEELKALSPVGLSTPLAWLAAWWCAVCYMVRLLLLCPAAAGALWLHSALQEWELYAGSCQHLSQWVSGLQSSSTLLDISIGVSHAEDPWKTGKVELVRVRVHRWPHWRLPGTLAALLLKLLSSCCSPAPSASTAQSDYGRTKDEVYKHRFSSPPPGMQGLVKPAKARSSALSTALGRHNASADSIQRAVSKLLQAVPPGNAHDSLTKASAVFANHHGL